MNPMKKKVLIVSALLLAGLVLVGLLGTIGLSSDYEEYGLPAFFRVNYESTEEKFREFSDVEFKPWGFAFYLIAPLAVGFWAGRKWPRSGQ